MPLTANSQEATPMSPTLPHTGLGLGAWECMLVEGRGARV